jgi:hypothetical protein
MRQLYQNYEKMQQEVAHSFQIDDACQAISRVSCRNSDGDNNAVKKQKDHGDQGRKHA